MDEQRCSAPQIFQNTGTPYVQRKDHPSDKPPQRRSSLNQDKPDQEKQVRRHAAQYAAYSPVMLYYFKI